MIGVKSSLRSGPDPTLMQSSILEHYDRSHAGARNGQNPLSQLGASSAARAASPFTSELADWLTARFFSAPDQSTFYMRDPKGYTDYPFLRRAV